MERVRGFFDEVKRRLAQPDGRKIVLIPDDREGRMQLLEEQMRRDLVNTPGAIKGTVSFSGVNGYGQKVTETIDFDNRDKNGLPTSTLIVHSSATEKAGEAG